jgi:hypothetical protein
MFVEGTRQPPGSRRRDPLTSIWQDILPAAVSLVPVDRVVPISKRDIAAMNPALPRSGSAIPLDEIMALELSRNRFDVAVIAWDLVPAWDPSVSPCRYGECKEMYRWLSSSRALPELWRARAQARWSELESRSSPDARRGVQGLRNGEVMTVCMTPTFEDLLLVCERAIRRALQVEGIALAEWPPWNRSTNSPETRVLQRTILAMRGVRPRIQIGRQIYGDMRTAKNEWGEHFLRHILNDQNCIAAFRDHPLVGRLAELLAERRP